MSLQENEAIFQSLRFGTVPESGHKAFAVGIERQLKEIERNLDIAQSGEGVCKFYRGDYGCGKTFLAKLTIQMALERNFATSLVVVSPNDTRFHLFDEVYLKIVNGLKTSRSKGGALADCIDKWIGKIEVQLEKEGNDPDADKFDQKIKDRFEIELAEVIKEEAGRDFVTVLRAYFDTKQKGDIATANGLLSWIAGSKNISASIKRNAGIKGEISSVSALTYLKGILAIIKRAGHPGLIIVVDEMETILRDRRDVRERSMNGLRQIIDAHPTYKSLLWVFTGTPAFFDTNKGVAGLAPLHDRIRFQEPQGSFVNYRQPQLQLERFNEQRLQEVAVRLRDIYPSNNKARLNEKVNSIFIEKLAKKVSEGLKGNMGVVPRHFFREFVNILDQVEDNEDYNPDVIYKFPSTELIKQDQEYLNAEPIMDSKEDGSYLVY